MEEQASLALRATAFNKIAAILGGSLEWDADHTSDIAAVVNAVVRKLELPSVSDQDEPALRYWSRVADIYGIGHDDADEVEW